VGGPAGSTFAAGAVRTGLEEDRRNLVGMAEASRRNSRCREGTVAAGRPGCKAQRRDGSVEAVVGIGEVHPDSAEVSQQLVVVQANRASKDASRTYSAC
jgi:hypothetical protein